MLEFKERVGAFRVGLDGKSFVGKAIESIGSEDSLEIRREGDSYILYRVLVPPDDCVIRYGKHRGKKLAELSYQALASMYGAWLDSKKLRDDPFLLKIRVEMDRKKPKREKKSVLIDGVS